VSLAQCDQEHRIYDSRNELLKDACHVCSSAKKPYFVCSSMRHRGRSAARKQSGMRHECTTLGLPQESKAISHASNKLPVQKITHKVSFDHTK
jgi:hypothetical protein